MTVRARPPRNSPILQDFGGGAKPIGGLHENYGLGAKTGLLPWNRYGMLVISWVDGEPAMIWFSTAPTRASMELRLEEVIDDSGETSLDEVVYPYDDPDRRRIRPGRCRYASGRRIPNCIALDPGSQRGTEPEDTSQGSTSRIADRVEVAWKVLVF